VTTSATARQPWDDRRLEAAFAARAGAMTTPSDLVETTLDRVRTAERPAPSWRRWLPAAAVFFLAVGVAAGGLALSDEVVGRRLFRPGPTPDLKTLDTGEFAFDYPASWLAYDASASFSGGSATAVLGTMPVERRCGDERHVDINCVSEQRLEPGQVRLYVGTGSYRSGTIWDRPTIENGTVTRVEVGRMPATFAEGNGSPESYYREDKSLHWEIARPGMDGTSVVELEGLLKEPGVAEGREQLEALIASFRFTNGPDPSMTPTPEPSPTETAPRLADLRVMTVEELIAATESPTPEEVIVHGWLTHSEFVRINCGYDLDPHPLIPGCPRTSLFLIAEPEPVEPGSQRPSVPHVEPILLTDGHRDVDIPPEGIVEVRAIGHLLDHRWTTCPEVVQAECKSRFVIDRVIPVDQPPSDNLPSPWAIPADFPTAQPDEPVEVLSSIVGGLTVVSIGNADANGVRSIEPLVEEINEGQGAWVIRALVGGDPTPVARTFLVGHIGWYTLFEVTESGLVDRTPPAEVTPSSVPIRDPLRAWPPEGVLDVPMPAGNTGRAPKAGVVDRTGLLVDTRAPSESDPPMPVLVDQETGSLVTVQAAPDAVVVYWSGSLCDDRFVLTLYGEHPSEALDHLELRGERGSVCRLARVGHGIYLRFSKPVDARGITVIDHVGRPYEAFPPVHSTVVSLPKAGGGFEFPKVRAALVDLSGRITAVRLPRPDEPRPKDRRAGPGAIVPDPTVAGRYHLMWNGGICTQDIVITIDATLSNVLVSNPVTGECDTIGNEYRLILDIDGPVGVPAVEVRYADTSAGAS
jgi:hypothetical protein